MAYGKKVDANQQDIVKLFRQLGCQVAITSSAGDGFPDLVIQRRNPATKRNRLETYLVEIKDGSLSPSRRKLTPEQVKFHAQFLCHIVESEQDVYDLLGFNNPDTVSWS